MSLKNLRIHLLMYPARGELIARPLLILDKLGIMAIVVAQSMPTVSLSAVIQIPSDYPTVQQGLGAAAENDTVLVADGIYCENLIFPNINLTLGSWYLMDGDTNHVLNAILDGSQPINLDSGSVIYMEGGQDSNTVITGLTIQGGTGTLNEIWWPGFASRYGGGCALRNAYPILSFNQIRSNNADLGGGIYLGTNANARLENNEIFNNQVILTGGGIRGDSCSPQLVANHIHDNISAWEGGGLFFLQCDNFYMEGCAIDHNQAPLVPGGIFGHGTYALVGNVIEDHITDTQFDVGAGLSFGAGSPMTYVTLLDNQFLRNTGGHSFGALSLLSGVDGLISGNLFQDNSSVWAAGFDLWDGTYTVCYNQIFNNSGQSGGTIYIGTGAHVEMFGNNITANTTSSGMASAIYAYPSVAAAIHNNNIYGNSPPAVGLTPPTLYPYISAENNWWGDPSGPYHPILNPNGLGDAVGDSVHFVPWLTSEVGVEPSPPNIMPSQIEITAAYPNPFNADAFIRFQLPHPAHIELAVWDTAGRRVAQLINGWRQAGEQQARFNSASLPSGIYIYRLSAGSAAISGKLVLLK